MSPGDSVDLLCALNSLRQMKISRPILSFSGPEYSQGNRCTISLVSMSTEPQFLPSSGPRERNWIPVAVAASIVLIAATVVILVLQHGKTTPAVTPVSAPLDPYAANLPITNLAMSESTNFVGGKVTYLDGHIANKGPRTVTGITVQVLFRDTANEVTQNETQPLKFIRMRQPYIDIEPVSADPLNAGEEKDFRLIFDAVSPDWNGAYPQVRIIGVTTK